MHARSTGTESEPKPTIDEIVRDHYAKVYRFCVRRVGSNHAADAAQETFLTAQHAIRRFRGESSIATWLFGIANNECRRISRKHRMEPCPLEIDMPSQQVDSEHDMVDREMLRRAMASLSPEHREVVLLHEVEGLTYDEAAVVIGVPPGTVKSRLHYAFLQLRQSIVPTGVEA